MKKVLLIGLAATAMLASCSNDETVEMAQQKAIGFSSFVNKSTRGATDITSSTINNFSVYSYQNDNAILSDELVTKTNNTWTYTNTQYWASATYNFFAISPGHSEDNDKNSQDEDSWTYTPNKDGGTITFKNPKGTTDLLYDEITNVTGTTDKNDVQQFTFEHLLSRVRFTFKESFTNDKITIKVTDLKISEAKSEGTYNENDKWTVNDNSSTAAYTFTVDEFSTLTSSDHFYFIPTTQDIKISFNVEAFQDGLPIVAKNTKEVTIENFNMEAGKSYEFSTTFDAKNTGETESSLSKIEFSASVSGWRDEWTNQNMTATE